VVEVGVLDYYDEVDVSRIYFFWKVGGNGGGVNATIADDSPVSSPTLK
jgi:hypothetical protein